MQTFFRKPLMGLAAKTLVIALLLFGGYFILVLRPALAIPKALENLETMTAAHYLNLIQNRTALTAFTKLELGSGNFSAEKQKILGQLLETNETGLKLAEQAAGVQKLNTANKKLPAFVNSEFPEKFSRLVKEEQAIWTEQQKLLNTLSGFADAAGKLFAYDPALDLGRLNLPEQRGELASRARTGISGLQAISQNLNEPAYPFSLSQLINELDQSQRLLEKLAARLETENLADAEEVRSEFIAQFKKPQNTARGLELSLIRSNSSITLAARQTNLIREFDFLLKKISELQRQLE